MILALQYRLRIDPWIADALIAFMLHVSEKARDALSDHEAARVNSSHNMIVVRYLLGLSNGVQVDRPRF